MSGLAVSFLYIDPAATSYIIQILAGVVISTGVVVGIFWKKFKLFFKNRKLARIEKKILREQGTNRDNKNTL